MVHAVVAERSEETSWEVQGIRLAQQQRDSGAVAKQTLRVGNRLGYGVDSRLQRTVSANPTTVWKVAWDTASACRTWCVARPGRWPGATGKGTVDVSITWAVWPRVS